MSTNVPRAAFSTAGIAAPTEAEIKAGLWADFQAAFGGNLNESDATPQGQLVTALAAILGASNDLLLQYVNLVDPAFSSGRMQDAIARIYFLTRIAAQTTIVAATCTGAEGTVIPAGALAQATDGTIYQSLAATTIPSGGSVTVSFAAIDAGPTACPAGTLTGIYRVVPGWDAITNPADGVIGRDTETRADFEARRAASVAINAAGILPALHAAVLNVSGVADAYATENPTGSPVTIGGVSVAARSLYVAAYGGADADVARAIWSKKPPGCGYTGDTTVTITDTSAGYELPYPSYSVTFKRATALPIYMAVQIADNGTVPSNASNLIKDAIVAAFAGADGSQRARIGGKVYALRFASAIAALGSWVQVVSITVGTTSSPTAAEVAVNIDKFPTIDPAHITVALV